MQAGAMATIPQPSRATATPQRVPASRQEYSTLPGGTGFLPAPASTPEDVAKGENLARETCKWARTTFQSGSAWEPAGQAALDTRLWSGVRVGPPLRCHMHGHRCRAQILLVAEEVRRWFESGTLILSKNLLPVVNTFMAGL